MIRGKIREEVKEVQKFLMGRNVVSIRGIKIEKNLVVLSTKKYKSTKVQKSAS